MSLSPEKRIARIHILLNNLETQVKEKLPPLAQGAQIVPYLDGMGFRKVIGYRYAQFRFNLGLANDAMVKKLKEGVLWQLIPNQWDPAGPPLAYVDKREIVIEIPLPILLQKSEIYLSELGDAPRNGNHIVLGKDQARAGKTIRVHKRELNHFLFAGMTDAGKSWAMRLILFQALRGNLGLTPENYTAFFILACGKKGEGPAILSGLPGQIAPIARTEDEIINALGYAFSVMQKRNQAIGDADIEKRPRPSFPPLYVLFDDFDGYTAMNASPIIISLMGRLSRRGRTGGIHLLAGIQTPYADMFGDSTTRQQYEHILCGKVMHSEASKAALGDGLGPNPPNAADLLKYGDFYFRGTAERKPIVARIQVAIVSDEEITAAATSKPKMEQFPEFDPDLIGLGNGKKYYTISAPNREQLAQRIALGMAFSERGIGRPKLREILESDPDLAYEGSSKKLGEILKLGSEIGEALPGAEAAAEAIIEDRKSQRNGGG